VQWRRDHQTKSFTRGVVGKLSGVGVGVISVEVGVAVGAEVGVTVGGGGDVFVGGELL
jgi:hypothetical protein